MKSLHAFQNNVRSSQPDETPGSFARATSLCFAAASLGATWAPPAAETAFGEFAGTATDTVLGLGVFAGLTFNALGAAVIFAAPRGRRRLGFWVNAAHLTVVAIAVVLGLRIE